MSAVELTAIIPIRNRSGVRLENCLRSLRWQRGIDSQQLEVLVSDFGSDNEHTASVCELTERYGATLVRHETSEVWNRSKTLNIGIRAASGRFCFCTDVDMIFAPNFIASALEEQQKRGGAAMVYSRCHDLPEDVPLQPWRESDYVYLRGRAGLRNTSGTGACQVATKRFFQQVRGFDEKMTYWGAEDEDMRLRAAKYGLEPVWLEGTSMLHQWHPTMKNDPTLRIKLNKWRLKLTRGVLVKNGLSWGGV